MEKLLLVKHLERVTILTLNRPEKLNALNLEIMDDIIKTIQELRLDDDVWAVVITGSGRGFSSGADFQGGLRQIYDENADLSRESRLDIDWVGILATSIYRTLDKPIIAAVNGIAAGAGMSIALACDMRVGSEKACFKTVFVERSLSPDTGLSYFLPRVVGYSRACDLVYTSRLVDAQEAYRIGLLDKLVPSDSLLHEAVMIANQIASWPPIAMQSTRRVMQQSVETASFEEQLRNEYLGLVLATRSPHDLKESRDAFIEKRPAKFTGK